MKGSITKHKSGFRAFFLTPLGKRISKVFPTRQEADRWLIQQNLAVGNGDFVEPSELFLGQWLVQWLTTYEKPRVQPNTYISYHRMVSAVEPIAYHRLQAVSVPILQEFFNNVGISAYAKKKLRQILARAFRKAMELGIITKNPVQYVTVARYSPPPVEVIPLEDLHLILDNAVSERYRLLFELTAVTGLRMGEALALRTDNIHGGYIHISNAMTKHDNGSDTVGATKTESSVRDVPISATLSQRLLALTNTLHGYIFHTSSGKPVSHHNTEREWRLAQIRAGIVTADGKHRYHFHQLRHTAISTWLANGIPVANVSKLAGHKNAGVTLSKYTHVVADVDKQITAIASAMVIP